MVQDLMHRSCESVMHGSCTIILHVWTPQMCHSCEVWANISGAQTYCPVCPVAKSPFAQFLFWRVNLKIMWELQESTRFPSKRKTGFWVTIHDWWCSNTRPGLFGPGGPACTVRSRSRLRSFSQLGSMVDVSLSGVQQPYPSFGVIYNNVTQKGPATRRGRLPTQTRCRSVFLHSFGPTSICSRLC